MQGLLFPSSLSGITDVALSRERDFEWTEVHGTQIILLSALRGLRSRWEVLDVDNDTKHSRLSVAGAYASRICKGSTKGRNALALIGIY